MGKSILELFQTEQLTFVDNGKTETAQQHFAVRNSKDIKTTPKSLLLYPAFKARDLIQKVTSRREKKLFLKKKQEV